MCSNFDVFVTTRARVFCLICILFKLATKDVVNSHSPRDIYIYIYIYKRRVPWLTRNTNILLISDKSSKSNYQPEHYPGDLVLPW